MATFSYQPSTDVPPVNRKRSLNDDTISSPKTSKTEPNDESSSFSLFEQSETAGHTSTSVLPEPPNTPKSFKLENLLPRNIQEKVLSNDAEVSKQIFPYLEKLISNDDTLDEINLNLPSSYASIFANQYSSSHLVRVVEIIMTAFPNSKVLHFPSHMKLDNLKTLVETLQTKLQVKPQYHEIYLPLLSDVTSYKQLEMAAIDICKAITCYSPQRIMLKVDDSWSFTKLKKSIEASLPPDNRPEISKDTKPKKQREGKQKSKKGTTKKQLPKLSSLSQMYTYDFHLMSPYIPGTEMFTAYSYWKMETIHKQCGYTGKDVTVAILDTGVNTSHPAFEEKGLSNILCFPGDLISNDTVGHGTMCAGILCGRAFEWNTAEKGDVRCPDGIAPDANLIVYKVSNDTNVETFSVVTALEDIRDYHPEVDVVSISLGSLGIDFNVANAINDLVKNGVIVVCAASNYGHQYSQTICFPARMGNVLCIGSHDSHGKASSFSPVGQQIDFLAPGEAITGPNSTLYDSSICTDSGTSFAAPAVADLVCLIIEFIKKNAASNEEAKLYKNHWVMKEILRKISTCPGRHTYDEGFGALNPIGFFRRPHEVIRSVYDEVLQPSAISPI